MKCEIELMILILIDFFRAPLFSPAAGQSQVAVVEQKY